MVDNNCFYCTKSEKLHELMLEICQLRVSTLFLLKDQAYKGRCIVQYKDHKTEIYQLDEKDLELYFKDVADAAEAVSKVFNPDKLNYGIAGDGLPHVHLHLVPKYKDGPCWGRGYDSVPVEKKLLTDEEYAERIELIKRNLSYR